jgi:glycosyltransferase involved in cell wall biosynthesis
VAGSKQSATVRNPMLLAGAPPGDAAGNASSSETLLAALTEIGQIDVLTHVASPIPFFRSGNSSSPRLLLGTQPFSIHGEALIPGLLHRRRLQRYASGWVVNSRYAGSLYMAGVPYAIWEGTTTRDELRTSDRHAIRTSGRGTGLGRVIHELLLPVGERIEGLLYRGAAALLAMSDYTRTLMIDTHGLPPERVRVLPHPPTPTFLAALSRARRDQPRQGEANVAFRLLFVGRVDDPRKNFPLLLDAYLRARAMSVPLTLTIVGPHSEKWRASLEDMPRENGITIMGRVDVDSLARAYLNHDALVLTSKQEGFGIVVAEAFHAGLPVVSTSCGGPEAAITTSGGGLLTGHSTTEVAEALARVAAARSDTAAMAQRALRYAATDLSFDRFKERVSAITRELQSAPHTRLMTQS